MLLSPGATTTTTICKPVMTKIVRCMSSIMDLLKKGTESQMCGGKWLQPSKDLERIIVDLDKSLSSTAAIAVKERYEELFRIRRKDQMEEEKTELFDWTSSSFVSAQIIHTGAQVPQMGMLESCCSGPGTSWQQSNMTETNRKQS